MFNMLDLTETEQIYMSSSDQKYPLNIQASFHVLLQSLIVVCAKEKTYEDAVKQHLLQSELAQTLISTDELFAEAKTH